MSSIDLCGKPFQLLSDGKALILLLDDTAIVVEDHFLKSLNFTYEEQQNSFMGEYSFRTLSYPEIDLSIVVNGEINQYKGKDILSKFDIFKNFKVTDLLNAIKIKLKSREEKLSGQG